MKTSESTVNIAPALAIFLAGLTNPPKTEEVKAGQKRYSFAPLPDILDQVREDLGTCQLSLTMECRTDEYGAGVTAILMHSSGEWIEYGPLMLPAGDNAQSAGSAITYARRYMVCAILNIAADEDDDGAKAKESAKDWGRAVTSPSGAESGTRDHSTRTETDVAAAVVPDSASPSGGSDASMGKARSDPSETISEEMYARLVAAYGTQAKALIRAKKAWGDVRSLVELTTAQATTLLEAAP